MADRYDLARIAEAWAAEYQERQTPTIQDWFMLAWARSVPALVGIPNNALPTLNLGAGNRFIGDSVPLDLEHGWNGETDKLPYDNGKVAGIWAHGFFEHISPENVPRVLYECQRVLCWGGVLNIVVPHSLSDMYPEDITHKSFWHEETITNIFRNPYYTDPNIKFEWLMQQHACFIMGVVWRNLGLFIQLVKEPK